MKYIAKPCRTERAYEVIPEKELNLDLDLVVEKLKNSGYTTVIRTPHIAIVKKEFEVSLYPSGRILIKKAESREIAEKIADEIYGVIS